MFNNLVKQSGQKLIEKLSCAGPDVLQCLQAVDADPVQSVQDILVPNSDFFISAPNIDFVSNNP